MAEANIEPLIEFKPLSRKTLEWARKLHNDPEVLKMLTDPRGVSWLEQKKWFKSLKKSNSSQRWVVYIGETPVGVIRLDQIDRQNRSICIGMDLHYLYRGKGLAKPIYEKLIRRWFSIEGFERVWLLVADFNERAKKLYESLGFVVEGRQRNALLRFGPNRYDYIMMSILKDEWIKRND